MEFFVILRQSADAIFFRQYLLAGFAGFAYTVNLLGDT